MVPDMSEGERSRDSLSELVKTSLKHSENGSTMTRSRSRSPSPLPIRIPGMIRPKLVVVKQASSRSLCEENQAERKGEVEEGAYLRSRLWWVGMILITVGEGGNFLSYGFAPASVVAPLGTVVSPTLPIHSISA